MYSLYKYTCANFNRGTIYSKEIAISLIKALLVSYPFPFKKIKKCILKLLFIVLALCCCCKFKWRIKYEILEFISQSQMKGECYFFSPLSLNFPKPRLFSLRIGSTYYLQAIHIYVLFNSVQLFKDHQIKISLFFKNNLRRYICHDLRYFSGLFVYYFFLLWMLLEEKVIFSQPDEVTVTLK